MRHRLGMALGAVVAMGLAATARREDDELRGVGIDELELGPDGIQRKEVPKPESIRVHRAVRQPNWDRYERVTGRTDEDILERRAKQSAKLARRAARAHADRE